MAVFSKVLVANRGEIAGFARACGEADIVWIGPPPDAIEAMGSKIEARERMRAAGVPIVPGVTEPVASAEEVRRLGDELGSPGTISAYREPAGPGVRIDSGVVAGNDISALYDPMIAKLITHGVDREHARRRMLRALDELVVDGVKTLVGFHKALLMHPCFVEGETCHGLVESELLAARAAELENGTRPGTVPGHVQGLVPAVRSVEVDGKRFEVRVLRPEPPFAELARRRRERVRGGGPGAAGRDAIVSPMQGTVLAVEVAEGDEVEAGRVICIIEAMKMENEGHAHRAGRVTELSVAPGQPVKTGQVICVVSGD